MLTQEIKHGKYLYVAADTPLKIFFFCNFKKLFVASELMNI